MSKKPNRFSRLEFSPILKIFKKPKGTSKRFLHLEVDGHKIKVELTNNKAPERMFCPKCGHANTVDSLYCSFCSYAFDQNAQKTSGETNLKPWQKKCPGCGTICNRSQKYCLYCGWRIAYWTEEEQSPAEINVKRPSNSSRYKNEIKLTIDGTVYSSNDVYIPTDIRQLMDKIDKEGYSKEMVENWIKERNLQKEMENFSRQGNSDSDTSYLQWQLAWKIVGVILSIFVPIIFILLRLTIRR